MPLPVEPDIRDRRIASAIVSDVKATLGITFTLDGACNSNGNNAHCKRYCSPKDSFLDKQLKDEIVWLNPPFNRMQEFVQHYVKCKAKHPTTVSACICVPDWDAPWKKDVQHMRVLKRFPKGSYLFDQPKGNAKKGRQQMGPTPWPVLILYDAPSTCYAASAAAQSEGLLMRFPVKILGHDANSTG